MSVNKIFKELVEELLKANEKTVELLKIIKELEEKIAVEIIKENNN